MAVRITTDTVDIDSFSQRPLARNSNGILYVVLKNDTNNRISVFKGNGIVPTGFSEMDSGGAPSDTLYMNPSVDIDDNDVLHIAYIKYPSGKVNASLRYVQFRADGVNDDFQNDAEVIADLNIAAGSAFVSIALDSSYIPHIAYSVSESNMGTDYLSLYCVNKIGGSWQTPVYVYGASEERSCSFPQLIFDSDALPCIAFRTRDPGPPSFVSSGAAQGDATDTSSFTVFDLPDDAESLGPLIFRTTMALDASGNHWCFWNHVYNEDMVAKKHIKGNSWATWGSEVLESTGGFDLEAISDGSDIYVLYLGFHTGAGSLKYRKFTDSWEGETTLHSGTYRRPKGKWAYTVDWDSQGNDVSANASGRWEIDYLYLHDNRAILYWDKIQIGSSSSSSSKSSSSKSSSSKSSSSSSLSVSSSSSSLSLSSSSSKSFSSSKSSSSSISIATSSSSSSLSLSSSLSKSSSSSNSSFSLSSSSSSLSESSSSSLSVSSSSSSFSLSSSSSSSLSESFSSSSQSSSSLSSSSSSCYSSSSSSSIEYQAWPQWYNTSNTAIVSTLLSVRLPTEESNELVYHLWNNQDIWPGATLTEIKLGVSCSDGAFSGRSNAEGQEVVKEKWVSVKSNGAGGNSFTPIVDDAHADYKAIGGDMDANPGNYLSLGDIPTDCYRKIHIKIDVPEDAETDGPCYPALILQYTLEEPSVSSSSASYIPDSDDDFAGIDKDPPDSYTWDVLAGSPNIYNNQCRMGVTALNLEEKMKTKYWVSGAFDIQIDYSLYTYSSTDSWKLRLTAEPQNASGDWWSCSRMFDTSYFNDQIHAFEQWDQSELNLQAKVYASAPASGKLRLARESGSDIIKAYYWNVSAWQEISPVSNVTSSADMKFILQLICADSKPNTTVDLDNFILNIGTDIWV